MSFKKKITLFLLAVILVVSLSVGVAFSADTDGAGDGAVSSATRNVLCGAGDGAGAKRITDGITDEKLS